MNRLFSVCSLAFIRCVTEKGNPIGIKHNYELFLNNQVSEGYLNDINHLLGSISCTNTVVPNS